MGEYAVLIDYPSRRVKYDFFFFIGILLLLIIIQRCDELYERSGRNLFIAVQKKNCTADLLAEYGSPPHGTQFIFIISVTY